MPVRLPYMDELAESTSFRADTVTSLVVDDVK